MMDHDRNGRPFLRSDRDKKQDDRGLKDQEANISIDHSMLSLSVQALPAKIKRDVKARDSQLAAVSQKGMDGQHIGAAERV